MFRIFGFGGKSDAREIQVEAAEDEGCCGGHGHGGCGCGHGHQDAYEAARLEEVEAGGCCGGHGHHHAHAAEEEEEEGGCCGGHGHGGCGCGH